jgi:hypothetical protein
MNMSKLNELPIHFWLALASSSYLIISSFITITKMIFGHFTNSGDELYPVWMLVFPILPFFIIGILVPIALLSGSTKRSNLSKLLAGIAIVYGLLGIIDGYARNM